MVEGMPVSSWSFSAATPEVRRRRRVRRPRGRRRRPRGWRSSCPRPRARRRRRRGRGCRRPRAASSPARATERPAALGGHPRRSRSGPWARRRPRALDERERAPLGARSARRSSSVRGRPGCAASPTCSTPSRSREAVGERADAVGRGALGVRLGPGHDQVGIGEGGRSSRSVRRGRASAPAMSSSSRDESSRRSRGGRGRELRPSESVLGGAGAPVLAQPRQVDVLLAVARLDRGDLGGVEARRCPARSRSLDAPAPAASRTRATTAAGTPAISAIPLLRRLPLDPERAGQLGAQVGLVEVAGGEPVGLQDRLAVERAPLAVARAAAPCWRRSRACAGADPAPARCGAGTRRRRSRGRARACDAVPCRGGRRTPRPRGRRAPPARRPRAPG